MSIQARTTTADHVETHTLRILLVEDDDADAAIVMDHLRNPSDVAGVDYHVDRVRSLRGALLHLSANEEPDCVLLDLGLPDGGTIADPVPAVIDSVSLAPVIVLSGNGSPAVIRQAMQQGANDYLIKDQVTGAAQLRHAIDLARQRVTRDSEASDRSEFDAFAHELAHDIQGPIRGIGGLASLLATRGESMPLEQRADLADRVAKSAVRLGALVDGLLTFATAGDRRTLRPVAPGEVALWVNGLIADRFDNCGGVLHIGDMPAVLADEDALRIILLNLLSNAVNYRDETRPLIVSVKAHAADGLVRLTVSDNGVGVPVDERARVFERAVRLQAARHRGWGIGLTTVQRVVDALGGRVWLDEGPSGIGTTVTVELPAA